MGHSISDHLNTEQEKFCSSDKFAIWMFAIQIPTVLTIFITKYSKSEGNAYVFCILSPLCPILLYSQWDRKIIPLAFKELGLSTK